jgi:hypothetical protein
MMAMQPKGNGTQAPVQFAVATCLMVLERKRRWYAPPQLADLLVVAVALAHCIRICVVRNQVVEALLQIAIGDTVVMCPFSCCIT